MDLDRTFHPLLLLYILLSSLPNTLAAERSPPLEVTRQNIGDVFKTEGMQCSEETCIGLSSGTATTHRLQENSPACGCRCHDHLPVFREDLAICVDDIHECVLAPFVGGSTVQKIPFVFLPLKGQIIHPSKEISFTGIERPVCAVSGAKYLTENGWTDLRNILDLDVPFRLYRDEGRTFLQWVGEPELRSRMSGRLVLVYLMCRDVSKPEEIQSTTHTLFSPCVAFRVVGSPKRNMLNISEVTFFPDARSSSTSAEGGGDGGGGDRLGAPEYAAIGACSVLLGLVYAASVLLYLHLRRRSRLHACPKHADAAEACGEGDGDRGGLGGVVVVKSNPLLGQHHFAQEALFSDGSDGDGASPPDLLQRHPDRPLKTTAALIHPSCERDISKNFSFRKETTPQDQSPIEKLPEENVSITETLENREERSDCLKALTGNARKKLYFNPAYFEPQLLLAPPPAALEFLCKIREVISVAKQKMAVKRFAPSLSGIPEEELVYPVEPSQEFASLRGGSRGSSLVSLKRENSRRRGGTRCEGCPGCYDDDDAAPRLPHPAAALLGACRSCAHTRTGAVLADNKQQSIRRWLEGVSALGRCAAAEGEEPRGRGHGEGGPRRRVRSPARSLPPGGGGGAMCARPTSPKAASEMAGRSAGKHRTSRSHRHHSAKSEDDCSTSQPSTRSARNNNNNNNNKSSEPMSLPPPDMIHEAMALDSRRREPPEGRRDGEGDDEEEEEEEEVRIPTITRKNMRAVIHELHAHGRRRPAHPYESDSLEKEGRRTPSEYADVPSSSQHSPNLSAALPMAEEVTMGNAVFEKAPPSVPGSLRSGGAENSGGRGHRYGESATVEGEGRPRPEEGQEGGEGWPRPEGPEGGDEDDEPEYELMVVRKEGGLRGLWQRGADGRAYSLVSEVYVNSGYSCGSGRSSPGGSPGSTMDRGRLRVRYEGQPGKLLIEVEDCPDNYIPVRDEDTFEPDTLDRKPPATVGADDRPRPTATATGAEYSDSLERPQQQQQQQQILLRTSGSFRLEAEQGRGHGEEGAAEAPGLDRAFGSLREIYEARLRGLLDRGAAPEGDVLAAAEGRLLTLEERQRRRQRKNSDPDSPVRPDVIPPPPPQRTRVEPPLYERPKPPRRVLDAGLKSGEHLQPRRNDETQPVASPPPPINGRSVSPVSTGNGDHHHHYDVAERNTDILADLLHPADAIFPRKNDHVVLFSHRDAPSDVGGFKLGRPSPRKKHEPKRGAEVLARARRKPCPRMEDSGYLSTDSSETRCRLELEGGSETEDSFGDGHSESGAESVETHSVFFDVFRRPGGVGGATVRGGGVVGGEGVGGDCNSASMDSGLVTDARSRDRSVILMGEGRSAFPHRCYGDACSDSETVSYATVVPFASDVSTLSSNDRSSSVTRR